MVSLLGPKCFLSTAFFFITIISIYGIVGAIYNHLQINQTRDIGEWPFNIRPLFQAFTIIQSLLPLVGLFALIAVCKRNPLFLFGSGSVLLAIFTSSFVFGIVSYRVAPKEILENMYKTFRKCSNDSSRLEWMNDIQSQYRCCGVYKYMDWYATDIKIPTSCCRQDIPHNRDCDTSIISAHGAANNGVKDSATAKIYLHGCGTKLANTTRESLEHLSLEMCICGGVSLIMAIFLYVGVTRFFLTTNGSSSQKTTGQPATISRKRSKTDANMNDDHDANNNVISEKQQRRLAQWRQKRQSLSPFAPIHSQGKGWSYSLRRDISKSKSFIIGDVPSQSLTPIFEENDTEVLRKNVDMLYYQSLDKNMSTLSTTPNDLSSMILSNMISQSKRQGSGNDSAPPMMTDDEAFALRNTVYTIVGERPFTTSLSQNCSSSLFNGNQIKQSVTNGDTIAAAGQSSPHCLGNKIRHAQKIPALSVDEISEEEEEDINQSTEYIIPQGPMTGQFPTDNITRELITAEENGNDETSLNSQVNTITATGHITTPNSKYPTTTSSVRSSTLATIQEESESAKGSPANTKAASPASGCLTPEAISPQNTQTKLFPNSDKDDNVIRFALELTPSNNNNLHCNVTASDMPPECFQ